MNPDDKIYISLLIISIPIGFIFKNFKYQPKYKAYASSLVGFLIALTVCSYDIYHSLVLSITNALLIKSIHPKYIHYFAFLWSFSYLLFFRLTYLFALPSPVAYANAVQLILTLKTVGLAFEVHDSYNRLKSSYVKDNNKPTDDKKKEADIEKLKLEIKFVSIDSKISFIEIICYYYCYIGILTGPYFKYRTYKDWLNFQNVSNIDSISAIAKRGRLTPFIIIGFLVLSKFVSFKDATFEEFYNSTVLYRLFYMVLIFTLFRFRFYIAWSFAEFSCFTAAFGAYPAESLPKPGNGPTDLAKLNSLEGKLLEYKDYNFETIHNINEYGVETRESVKKVLHDWNMTVQFWMAYYVYKRVPSKFQKSAGQPITMAVSAYWHGLHPGYYLGMLTTSPCILAESLMEKEFKNVYLDQKYYKYYDFFGWFFRTRQFDYMSIGFILLKYDLTIKFWSSVYFIGHFVCLFFIFLGLVLRAIRTFKKKSKKIKKDE